jgi:hypothetical protein
MSPAARFQSVWLATFFVIAHKIPNKKTDPIFIQAEGKIPIHAHDRRVTGFASREEFVNRMSITLSESNDKNQGTSGPNFHFNSPPPRLAK